MVGEVGGGGTQRRRLDLIAGADGMGENAAAFDGLKHTRYRLDEIRADAVFIH